MPPARHGRPVLSTGSPPPESPSPTIPHGADESWVSREVDAMASAWSTGRRVFAGEVIDRHPGLDDESAVRLIYEEVSLRREAGEDVPTTEVVQRYPRWKDELEVLLGCERLLHPLSVVADLPEVGEHLGPFFLRAELGRGASGKTYLASEPTLADRPVVLKVISDEQEEHLSLARLQHTNIIPLFSEHSFPERGLRALCMPYLGGTTLARIIEALSSIPPSDRRGRDIIHMLDRVQAAGPQAAPLDGPYRRLIEEVAYVDAACWIGIRLADALHEAHTHGLVHMDVKPSNVLIAADGSPMLLDFHLACRPIAAGERFPDRIGGTPGWMAPEHRAALDAVASGEPIPEPVDHRADIFALGLLLRDALGGPGAPGELSLRSRNPNVSVGLEDIISRCLADRPSARYPDAATLAEDLRLHFNHLPLRGVPNRSLIERWRKRRLRRRPWAPGRWVALASVLPIVAAIGFSSAVVVQRRRDITGDLREARSLCDAGKFAEAEFPLHRGLERASMFPRSTRLVEALDELLRVARRGQKTETLHALAEQVRFRYGLVPPDGPEAHALLRSVRTIWDDRELLIDPRSSTAAASRESQVRVDLLELIALWAELRIRLASPAQAGVAKADALAVLDQARGDYGPSFAIDRLRRSLAAELGRVEPLPHREAIPRSAFDHYDLGRSLLRAERFREAAEQFQRGLDQRPQDFWPNFYLGLCEYRLKHFDDAMAAFRTAIALAPARAECYFNRAMAAEGLGRRDLAHHDYTRALELAPRLTAARLNRGVLAYNSGRFADAIADLRRALLTAEEPRTIGRIQYNLALAYQARGEHARAIESADQAIASGDDRAPALRARLRAEP